MVGARLVLTLDRETVARLAGPRSYALGVEYAREGRVGPVTGTEERIEAVVQGEDTYAVRIAVTGSRIEHECSCPMGESGAFCKHCAALALAWADPTVTLSRVGKTTSRPSPGTEGDREGLIPRYLQGLDRASLKRLIQAEADRDPDLAERLRMRALVATPGHGDARRLRAEIDRATRVGDFLRYRDVPDYVRRVGLATDLVEQMIDDGQLDLAVELSERALRRLERALDRADDSDGLIGGLLRRFGDLHVTACNGARPDPIRLAERLARWELDGEWDVFRGAAEHYADVLGDTGLAAYRAIVEARWDQLPPLGPGDEDRAFERGDRFNVTYAMEALARASGDVDALIAVLARDQSSAYRFLTIAEVCLAAGRANEGLSWAERGVRAYPVGTDVRLRERLADLYLDRGRSDKAMALIWAELVERPALVAYQRLRRYADRIDEWPAWKTRATEEVRRSTEAAIATADARPRQVSRWTRRWDLGPDGSVLVEILAWDGELDAAWAEARRLGCSRSGWLRLARMSETSHPVDAAGVYRAEVEALLSVSDKRVYAEAVDLLRRLKPLMEGLGKGDEFASYARGVRTANVRRPAFIAIFDSADLIAAAG